MQMVAVKPVARWEIWLGKWAGIMLLNLLLLAVSGAAVYLLMQWRARQLPPEAQQKLRNEVLIARGSLKPSVDKAAIEAAEALVPRPAAPPWNQSEHTLHTQRPKRRRTGEAPDEEFLL